MRLPDVLQELEHLADFVDALLDGNEHEAHDLLVNSGEDMVDRAREAIRNYRVVLKPSTPQEFFALLDGAPQTVKIPAILGGDIIYPHVTTSHLRDILRSMELGYSPYDTITIDSKGEWWLENLA